jgi:hypothetical protein
MTDSAKQSREPSEDWIASSAPLLAMTKETPQNKNEQAIRVSPNRLLVEDLTAVGYPRPAPLLAASDHVFFEDRTAGAANRSALIFYFQALV